MKSILENLNEVQREAVQQTEGPVLILAGAGSGKTRTLSYRVAYLMDSNKVDPAHILAVTFTNKAAREMRNRIEALVGNRLSALWIGTFHSICARILRIESEHLGYSKNFTIYDVDEQVRALKKIIGLLSIPQQLYSPKMIQNRLSRIKNQFLYPEDREQGKPADELDIYMPDIYRRYQNYIIENNALDFDDLLMKPIELFERFPEIRKKYANKFKYVLVDEYQDTNHAQYLFIKKLVSGHHNICVVGDEDQSIYGWRGADINNILNFSRDFPDAKIFKMEENYRSNGKILAAANAVVENNKARIGKKLWTNKPAGDKVSLFCAVDDREETKHIVDIIHDQMFTHKRSFKDMAVLYRTNAQSRIFEDALRKNAINYTIVGGVKFFERKEIKDLLAYLKLIVNPHDSVSLKRIVNFPLRGIGEITVNKIEKFAEIENIILFEAMGRVDEIAAISPAMGARVVEFYKLIKSFIGLSSEMSPVELVSTLASETGILNHYKTEYDQYESESRVSNIRELFRSVEEFTEEKNKDGKPATISDYLEEVSLLTDVDTWNSNNNAVTLMTLHSAKGLEFPVVCITGMEMGVLPLQRNTADMEELEEERRLLYVGMTRAQEKLYLSYAKTRKKFNNVVDSVASLFIDEIPVDLIESGTEALSQRETIKKNRSSARRKKIQSYFQAGQSSQEADSEFKIGQPVYHATFGKGKIKCLEGSGDKMKITVFFTDENIEKKLIKKYANLTPIES
ncbi:MAG: UvrD-helicase domain-containing protein [Calditrichaceae bacterium]|nr:UvrD-helicase domain-containing protein [Calditrichaceae bacterium]RQV97658.1 MAG: hypothetical protein EH224_01170 [Calditrichota bacterium]